MSYIKKYCFIFYKCVILEKIIFIEMNTIK